MKRWIPRIALVFGVAMMLVGMGFTVISLVSSKVSASAVSVVSTQVIEMPIPVTGTPESTEMPLLVTATVEPTKVPSVVDYVLGEKVNLASVIIPDTGGEETVPGNPIALRILLPDGTYVFSNWAAVISYRNGDNDKPVFSDVSRGVIYSYLGDVTTTWAHSGMTNLGQRFFASNLDYYLRKTAEGKIITMAEALEKAEDLKGLTVTVCQTSDESIKPLMDYDPNSPCEGETIEAEIMAVAIVPREMVEEYDLQVQDINQWMVRNFPEAGFDKLSKDDGWLLRFCVGKLSDQVSDGTPSYLFNRAVIGLKVSGRE